MGAFHILKRVTDQGGTYWVSVPPNIVPTTPEALQNLAREEAAKHPNETLYLVQEIGKVSIEPVVTMTLEPLKPQVVYREAGIKSQAALELELEAIQPEEGPKRDPQAKPRLLIVDRRATPAELVGHLIVVAEGRIIKNAFGALELDDIPGSEQQAVAEAMRKAR